MMAIRERELFRSNHMTENKKEIDLELKDILLEFLRRWKVIVLFAVVFGLAFGAIRYRKDYVTAHIPAPEVKNTTLEEAYADLDKDQIERVITAVQLKAAIDSKSAYMNESVLMRVDAHAEDAVILQYTVESGEAGEVVNNYVNYINSGSIIADLNKDGLEAADHYLAELISVVPNQTTDAMSNFTVKVVYDDAEHAAILADAVDAQLAEYAKQLNQNGREHFLSLDSRNQVQVVDEELAKKQDDYAKETADQQNDLASIKTNMNANQLRVYLDMEREVFTWGDTDTEEAAQTDEEEVTSEVQAVSVSVNKRQILMGAVVGAALAVVYIFLAYLLSTRVRTKEEIVSLYQVRILGTARKDQKKHVVADLVWKLENLGHKKLSSEQQVQMIVSNIYISCKDRQTDTVYLTGSIMDSVDKEFLAMLEEGLKQKNIRTVHGGAINYNAEELLHAAETGTVVFVERRRDSYYSEIRNELQLCDANNIQVLGMIMLEN